MAEFKPGPYKAGDEVTVNGVIWVARKDIKYATALPKAGTYWMLKPEPAIDKDAIILSLNTKLKESDTLLNFVVTERIKQLIQPPITLRMLGHLIYQQGKEPEPVPNTAPTANAGTGSEITLPVSSVQANGSGSDLEGPVTYNWKQLIGPKPAVISNPTIPNPVFSEMTLAGTYSFELTVTDAGGLKATSTVIYTVKPEPVFEDNNPTYYALLATEEDTDLWYNRFYNIDGKQRWYNMGDTGYGTYSAEEGANIQQWYNYQKNKNWPEPEDGAVYVYTLDSSGKVSQSTGDNDPDYETGKGIMSAAFLYMINRIKNPSLALECGNAAKEGLFKQINEPTGNRANLTLWPRGGNNFSDGGSGFLICMYEQRLLMAYSYIKPILSNAERTQAQTYFTNVGLWAQDNINHIFRNRYVDFDGGNYEFVQSSKDTFTAASARLLYQDGPLTYTRQRSINNRFGDYAVTVGLIGVEFENTSLINTAKRYFEMWLTHGVFPDGTPSDMYRWTDGSSVSPGRCWAYCCGCADQAIRFAIALAYKGDKSLIEFKTKGGYLTSTDGVSEKSILKVATTLINYTNGTLVRYAHATSKESRYRINGTSDTTWSGSYWYGVHPTWFCIGNRYWKNQTIKDAYERNPAKGYVAWPQNPMNGRESSFNAWTATMPATCFMYADFENEPSPFPGETTPQTGVALPDYTDYEAAAFVSPGTPVALKTSIAAIPTQISNLRISGTPLVGQTITAVTDSVGTYAYQWIRTDANGENPAFIEGQTTNKYTLAAPDAGSRFMVQATNSEGLTVTSLKTQTVEAVKNWVSENMVFNTTGQTFRSTRGILGNGKLEFKLGNPNALSGYVGADQGTYYPQNIFEADYIFTLNDAGTGKGFNVREKAASNIYATLGANLITYYWEIEQEVLTASTSKIRYKFKKQQGDLSITVWESKRVGNPATPLYFVAYLEAGQTVLDGKLWAESGKIVNVS